MGTSSRRRRSRLHGYDASRAQLVALVAGLCGDVAFHVVDDATGDELIPFVAATGDLVSRRARSDARSIMIEALLVGGSFALALAACAGARIHLRGMFGPVKRRGYFLLILLSCGHPPATTRVPVAAAVKEEPALRGHLLAENGAPLPLAHVTILGADGKPGERHAVGPDGAFRIPIASFTRSITRVRLSGAAHHTETLVIAREDGAVDVTVKLGAAAPRSEGTPAVILYSTKEPDAKAMARNADGSFSADVEAPDGRYGYIIAGVSNEPPVGDPVDGFELTANGEYRPQIVINGGKARITFDPKRLHESASTITFTDPASASAGLTAVSLRIAQRSQRGDALLQEVLKAKGGPSPTFGERLDAARRADTAADRKELAQQARTAARPIVKRGAAVAYFTGPSLDAPTAEEKALANEVLAEVSPDDALWSLFSAFDGVMQVVGPTPAGRAYTEAFAATQPDSGTVSRYLLKRIAATKDPAERRPFVDALKKPRFAGSMEQQQALSYDPDRPLAPGKKIAFDVTSLSGKAGARMTPKELVGKVFLVDVWGTWCAPCIAELPRLHEIHAKYGGAPNAGRKKRFEILSIALESNAEKVAEFRADKAHPMPWLHGMGNPDTFLEAFGGPVGVPLYVLVDAQGTVIESSPDLRLKQLPELLDRALR